MFAFPNQYMARMTNKGYCSVADSKQSPSSKENQVGGIVSAGIKRSNKDAAGNQVFGEGGKHQKTPMKNPLVSQVSITDTATI